MYYVLESSILKDDTNPIAVSTKDNLETAKMSFHQILASALANDNVTSVLAMIFDEAGNTVKKEYDVKE